MEKKPLTDGQEQQEDSITTVERPPAVCRQEECVECTHTESTRVEEEKPRETNIHRPDPTQPAGKCRENISQELEETHRTCATEEAAVRCDANSDPSN